MSALDERRALIEKLRTVSLRVINQALCNQPHVMVVSQYTGGLSTQARTQEQGMRTEREREREREIGEKECKATSRERRRRERKGRDRESEKSQSKTQRK